MKDDISNEELKLLHICDARSALELDGHHIAYIRLFEAYTSENSLNNTNARLIFDMANIAQNLKQINASALSLNFPFVQKSKRSNIQLPRLKKEINLYLNQQVNIDVLLYLGLLHGYISIQKTDLKYQVFLANTIVNHWLKENKFLQFPILPLANIIKSSVKEADNLLREAFDTGDMQRWILYFLNMIGKAALARVIQIRDLIQLKKITWDIMAKYTAYPLPHNEIAKLLFEKPFIKAADIIDRLNCHRQTASIYLSHLAKSGILIEKKSGREKLFFHKRLFDLLITE